MSLFFVTFFLLYSGIHLYIFLKARTALIPGIAASFLTAAIMIFMILAPVLVRLTEKAGHEDFARVLAYAGYTWMGGIFIFFVTGILCDLFRLIIYISGLLSNRDFSRITLAHRFYFITIVTITILVVVYGIFEARHVKVEHIIMPTDKLSPQIGKVRIVQISDVHLGLIIGEERIKNIVSIVQKVKPDILVSTGDLVDVQLDSIADLAILFQKIDTPYGKFAVTGNHEFYAGLDRSLQFTEKAGFKILREDVEIIPGVITIAGVDDEAVRGWRKGNSESEQSLCSHIDGSQYTVLLKHRPVPYAGSLCTYNLQLSGHTHRGQIFPFYLITKLFFKHPSGLHNLKNDSFLYVSRGTGTWGPPIRFLAPPEVTIIDVVKKDE